MASPSDWVQRWLAPNNPEIESEHQPRLGKVLDLASGSGRNALWLLAQGYQVTAADRDSAALALLESEAQSMGLLPALTLIETDFEATSGLPTSLALQSFDAVVVCNYLHRPLLPQLPAQLSDGGWMLYETFAEGNERYGRPTNPNFLLKPNELLTLLSSDLHLVAFEEIRRESPRARVQRLAARKWIR